MPSNNTVYVVVEQDLGKKTLHCARNNAVSAKVLKAGLRAKFIKLRKEFVLVRRLSHLMALRTIFILRKRYPIAHTVFGESI